MTRVRDYDFMVDRIFSDCKLVTIFFNISDGQHKKDLATLEKTTTNFKQR